MDIQYILCDEVHVDRTRPHNWFTYPFPVLAMLTDKNGGIIINGNTQIKFELKQNKPIFLTANLKRKPDLEHNDYHNVLIFAFKCCIGNGTDLFSLIDVPMFFSQENSDRLRDLLYESYKLKDTGEDNWLKTIVSQKRLCDEIVETIISSTSINKQKLLSCLKNIHCSPAIEYLNKNYMQPLDIPKLMKLCNLSRTHFFRLFKKQTNFTPFEYLRNCRIQEAQKMLLCTDLSIAEIGYRVGYSDQFHFSRMFKKEISSSPQNYRKQHISI